MRIRRCVIPWLALLFTVACLLFRPAWLPGDSIASSLDPPSDLSATDLSFSSQALKRFSEEPLLGIVLKSHFQDGSYRDSATKVAGNAGNPAWVAILARGRNLHFVDLHNSVNSQKKKHSQSVLADYFAVDSQPRRPANIAIHVALLFPKTKPHETFPFHPRSPCFPFPG